MSVPLPPIGPARGAGSTPPLFPQQQQQQLAASSRPKPRADDDSDVFVSERQRQQAASAPPGPVVSDPVRKQRAKPVVKRLPRSMLSLKPAMPKPAAGSQLVPTSASAGSALTPEEMAGADATSFLKSDNSSLIISRAAMQQWQDAVAQEAQQFSSVATYCDVTFQKVVAETRAEAQPSPLRIAVVCMLLDRLVAASGPQKSVLAKLHDELFNAVFTGWADYRQRKMAVVRKLQDTGDQPPSVAFDRDADLVVGTSHSQVNAANLFQRQTYFQALADLSCRREQVIGRPVRVLGTVLDLWRLKIEAIIFNLWRGYVNKVLSVRKRAAAYTLNKRCAKDRTRLETHFSGWRTYVFERRHQCRVVYEEQTRVKLVHRMGRKITVLEEENAALKAKYDRLFHEYCDVASRVTSMETLWKQFKRKLAGRPEDEDTDDDPAGSGLGGEAQNGGADASKSVSHAQPGALEGSTGLEADCGAADDASLRGLKASAASPEELVSQYREEGRTEGNDYLVEKAEEEFEALEAAGRELDGRGPRKRGPGQPKAALISAAPAGGAAPAGRVGHLAQYLDGLTAEATSAGGAKEGASATSPDKSGGRGRKTSKSPTKRRSNLPSPPSAADGTGVEGSASAAAGGGVSSTLTETLDYRSVLDWVTSRIQLFMTEKTVMRRCANFTVDFKDSTRLAYLLMSLGADRTLADEVLATKSPVERAALVCEAAENFNNAKPLQPLDIAKGKGSAIAAFLFNLYAHYSHVPLVLPNASLNPRLMAQLNATAVDAAAASPNRSFAPPPAEPAAGGSSPPEISAIRGALAASRDAVATTAAEEEEEDAEPLPDRQYVVWYKELAADDSETDDVEDYVDPMAKKRGAMDELAARLNQRTEISRMRTDMDYKQSGGSKAPAAKSAAESRAAKSEATVMKEHAARTKVRLVKWLADTINPLGMPTDEAEAAADKAQHLPGGEGGDAVTAAAFQSPMEMSNADLVDAITRTLVPDAKSTRAPAAGFDDPRAAKLRMKQLEQRLHQLRLNKVRLRAPQGAKAHDNVISLRQLVTALYVMNVDDPVVIV